jgi:uncharacterized protein YbjT (DUF2867 family)
MPKTILITGATGNVSSGIIAGLKGSSHRIRALVRNPEKTAALKEFLQPFAHCFPEAPGVGLVFETDDNIVRVAHDDHAAFCLAPSPALGPEVEDIVQVNIRQQR